MKFSLIIQDTYMNLQLFVLESRVPGFVWFVIAVKGTEY